MPRRSAEARAIVPEENESLTPSPETESAPPAKGVEISKTYIKDARARLESLKTDLKEAEEWGTATDSIEKIKQEIGELETFVKRHGKPDLRVVRPEVAPAAPAPTEKRSPIPEGAPRKLTVKEIDATLAELQEQAKNLGAQFSKSLDVKGQASVVKEQIALVNAEIADLKAQRATIIGRVKRESGTKGEPIARVTERMGKSFEQTREKKAVAEAREGLAVAAQDEARGRHWRKAAATSEGLAGSEAEAEFFAASDNEAHTRAEGMETLGEHLSPSEAAKEWQRMVTESSISDAETRQRTIAFIDRLHKRFPDFVNFTGADYTAALSEPQKVGFFKKLFGGQTRLKQMEQALESVPNVGRLYATFANERSKRDAQHRFKGVKGR